MKDDQGAKLWNIASLDPAGMFSSVGGRLKPTCEKRNLANLARKYSPKPTPKVQKAGETNADVQQEIQPQSPEALPVIFCPDSTSPSFSFDLHSTSGCSTVRTIICYCTEASKKSAMNPLSLSRYAGIQQAT